MSGARPEADPRFAFHGFWERAEHDADGRESFAAVERPLSDRLLTTISWGMIPTSPRLLAMSLDRGA